MTSSLNARSVLARLSGVLRTRRGATVAALAAFALLVTGLSQATHRSNTAARGGASVPLLSAAPQSTPSPAVSASRPPAASPTQGNDGPGSDNNPASNTGGFTQATITAGPTDPREAAINFLVKYLNTSGSPGMWRDSVKPYVTPALAVQIDGADPTRVPVGIVNQPTAVAVPVGDSQVAVTVNLIVDQYHPSKVVDILTVTLDGSTHRWLAAQLDATRPGGAT